MSNFFQLTGLDKDSLFAELDRDYYKAYPEQWDNSEEELFISHPDYTAIIEGQGNSHKRQRQKGEEVTTEYVKRDGYYAWKAGRLYTVKHHDSKMREVSLSEQTRELDKVSEGYEVGINRDGIIGKLKLIDIKVGKKPLFGNLYDELIFENV